MDLKFGERMQALAERNGKLGALCVILSANALMGHSTQKLNSQAYRRSMRARRLKNDDFYYTLPQSKSIEVGKAAEKKKLMWLLNGCIEELHPRFIKDSGADNGGQTADGNDEDEGEEGEKGEEEVDKEYENNRKLLKMLRTQTRRYCFSLLLMSSLPNMLSPNQ